MENGASTRQLKVAKELQKDLAEIIRSKGMAAFGGAMVSAYSRPTRRRLSCR